MTERRAKRAQYKVAEKQLRALDKRRKSLWKAEFLYVELEKPLFVGYEKYFAFRDDILMRPDFPILEKLLELINEVLFCKNKNFTKRTRRKTKRAYSEKGLKTVPIKHKILDLEHAKWLKLSRVEQNYFSPREIKANWGTYMVYEWNYPWMFVPKVRKKWITQARLPDATKMSQSDELENFIISHHLRHKITKIRYNCKQNWHKAENDFYDSLRKQTWREVRQELLNAK
ncbi:MAG: hypothetical protein RIS64_532 [Bacteroidota bacterium]|jgi:hypothetical protein